MTGGRQDPHAQARAARQAPLLLHSLSCFREVFALVTTHRKISTVIEIGVESGQVSGVYAELGASVVYCVDPYPTARLRESLATNDTLYLVDRSSPGVLPDLPLADLYVIDGDHNYATVRRELDWILRNAPDAIVVLHDVLWPCARRDQYYQPSPLAPADKHLTSVDGPTIWHDEPTPAGFVGLGAFTCAREAGGERNGVLTAIEDALTTTEGWHLEIIPAIFGLGVLARTTSETAPLFQAIRPYSDSKLLEAMENNRIALYTRVLQLQYEAAARADDADRLAESIVAQREETAAAVRSADHDRARIRDLHRENEQLRRLLEARNRGVGGYLAWLRQRLLPHGS